MPRIKLPAPLALLTLGLLSVNTAVANDADAYLRAISKRDASACYNVMDADKRTQCLAEVKAEPALCYSIIIPTIRDECMARARTKK